MKRKIDYGTVSFDYNEETAWLVFDAVLEYYFKCNSFCGETISQDDDSIISAPMTMENIADNVIKFKVDYED